MYPAAAGGARRFKRVLPRAARRVRPDQGGTIVTSSPRWLRGLSLAVSGLGVLGGASPVFAAETTAAGGLEEVTVTARKREETLQDAPVAITAISERQLEQYNIVLMEDIASLAGGGVL